MKINHKKSKFKHKKRAAHALLIPLNLFLPVIFYSLPF